MTDPHAHDIAAQVMRLARGKQATEHQEALGLIDLAIQTLGDQDHASLSPATQMLLWDLRAWRRRTK